jgi:hypothetical protein
MQMFRFLMIRLKLVWRVEINIVQVLMLIQYTYTHSHTHTHTYIYIHVYAVKGLLRKYKTYFYSIILWGKINYVRVLLCLL